MNSSTAKPLALGETRITAAARETLHPQEVLSALWRHAHEPWGEAFDPETKTPGKEDRRLVSNHTSSRGLRFKIATEPLRELTIVYLSHETDLSRLTAVQEAGWNTCAHCGG